MVEKRPLKSGLFNPLNLEASTSQNKNTREQTTPSKKRRSIKGKTKKIQTSDGFYIELESIE